MLLYLHVTLCESYHEWRYTSGFMRTPSYNLYHLLYLKMTFFFFFSIYDAYQTVYQYYLLDRVYLLKALFKVQLRKDFRSAFQELKLRPRVQSKALSLLETLQNWSLTHFSIMLYRHIHHSEIVCASWSFYLLHLPLDLRVRGR